MIGTTQHQSKKGQYDTERKALYPMGNSATSTPPKRSPTSANTGHTGTLFSSSPSRTVRYPVSPAKYSFLCVWRSSTTHAAQSACHLSNAVRPETCCEGVQDKRTSVFTVGPPALEGRETCKRRSSHQSSSWNRERGVLSTPERYFALFSPTNIWAEDEGLARRARTVGTSVLVKASNYPGGRIDRREYIHWS